MNFHFITLFESLIQQGLASGVVGQALKKELFSYETHNPRKHTSDLHQSVDARPYGGGDGMVMMPGPLDKTLKEIDPNKDFRRIYMSPQGKPLNDSWVKKNSGEKNWLILCGRYAGVDQRLLNHHDFEEVSLGDFVVSGGELPALVLVDALLRHQPGVLGHKLSAEQDSFFESKLEAPLYTRPSEILQQNVPKVLLSGDHAKIQNWKASMSLLVTFIKRSDLLPQKELTRVELLSTLEKISSEDLQLGGMPDKQTITKLIQEYPWQK